jgi:signal transduction histidine kinase
VELLALMQRISEQCRRTCGQQVEIDASGPLQVRGQSERLERVLGHMVHNALDATAGGGRTWVQVARSGNQAHICIGDTGCGMSASFIQNRLFKPFQSTKPAGMGIGAFESLQYVQELGGSIVVDSAEGQGTRMTLQLPLFESPLDVGPCAVRYTP